MPLQSKRWFILGGSISLAAALLHIAIIFGGAPAYRYFGAGEEMAKMATTGSILPALITAIIVIVLTIWGLYAFSGAGLIRRLPYLCLSLSVIAGIYTLRGIGLIPEVIWMIGSPKAVPPQEIVFSLVSLIVGISYLIGTITAWEKLTTGNE